MLSARSSAGPQRRGDQMKIDPSVLHARGVLSITENGRTRLPDVPRYSDTGSVRLVLPVPPSVNNLYTNSPKGRTRSKKYKDWARDACDAAKTQKSLRAAPVPCRVTVSITGGTGFSTQRDIDNCLKPVIDLLKDLGVIANDNVTVVAEVKALYLGRVDDKQAVCVVTVDPV